MRLGEVITCACACTTIAASAAVAGAADPPAPASQPPLPPPSEARPPPPPEPAPAPVPWHHHIEVGGGVAYTQMIVSAASASASPIRFQPGVGFHIDLSWQVLRYLRFTGYMVEHNNPLDIPTGALAVDPQGRTFSGPSVHVYSFGVRASPTLPIGQRVRLWLTAGAGWGYLGYPRFTPQPAVPMDAVNPNAVIRERSSTIFEIPVGVGYAIDIIPRWLSLHFEATCAFAPSQVGDAITPGGQYIDAAGVRRTVNPMPQLGATFVETLGLSLHL